MPPQDGAVGKPVGLTQDLVQSEERIDCFGKGRQLGLPGLCLPVLSKPTKERLELPGTHGSCTS